MKLPIATGRVENRDTWMISGANENEITHLEFMYLHISKVLGDNRYSKKKKTCKGGMEEGGGCSVP